MKVRFIRVEIFVWGKYGGFGRSTRLIGLELVKRGFRVCAKVYVAVFGRFKSILFGLGSISITFVLAGRIYNENVYLLKNWMNN